MIRIPDFDLRISDLFSSPPPLQWVVMQPLVEDFLQHLRHERGQAEHTQKTYAALLNKFVAWAAKQHLTDWNSVEFRHLMSFLQHERERAVAVGGRRSEVGGRRSRSEERRGGKECRDRGGG